MNMRTTFISICQDLVNIGNPKPCLLRFRLAAGAFSLLKKDVPFLERRVLGSPSHVRYVQTCRRLFLFNDMPKCVFWSKTDFLPISVRSINI